MSFSSQLREINRVLSNFPSERGISLTVAPVALPRPPGSGVASSLNDINNIFDELESPPPLPDSVPISSGFISLTNPRGLLAESVQLERRLKSRLELAAGQRKHRNIIDVTGMRLFTNILNQKDFQIQVKNRVGSKTISEDWERWIDATRTVRNGPFVSINGLEDYLVRTKQLGGQAFDQQLTDYATSKKALEWSTSRGALKGFERIHTVAPKVVTAQHAVFDTKIDIPIDDESPTVQLGGGTFLPADKRAATTSVISDSGFRATKISRPASPIP